MFRFTDLIIFRMTKSCNLNCKYCFMLDKGKPIKENLISQELVEKIINQIAAQRIINGRLGSLQLVLHGGEVLLLGPDRFYKILDYSKKTFDRYNIPYSFSIQTNATLLNEEFAKILHEFDVHVGLSYDGVEGANDNRTSIKQGVYDEVFELLDKHNVRYGFIVVASKGSIDKMSQTKNFLEQLPNVSGYKVNYSEDMLNPGPESEIEMSGYDFFKKSSVPDIEKFIETGDCYDSLIGEQIRDSIFSIIADMEKVTQTGCGGKSCGSALHMIAIEPNGDMDICDRFARHYDDPIINVQHALDYDFLAINQISHALMFHQENNKAIKKTGCDSCPADFMCKHGCMSFHYSKFNQQWGIDEYLVCSYYKSFFNYVKSNLIRLIKKRLETNLIYEETTSDIAHSLNKDMVKLLYDNGIRTKLYKNILHKNSVDIDSCSIEFSRRDVC